MGIAFSLGGNSFMYEAGFLNDIADPVIGGLYITAIASVMNLSRMLPSTFGLFLIKYLPYDVYNLGTLALAILCCPFMYWVSGMIDAIDVKKYRIFGDDAEDNNDCCLAIDKKYLFFWLKK